MNSKVNIKTTKDKDYKQVSLDDKNIAHLCFVGKDSTMNESVQFDVDVSKKDIKKFIKKLKKLIGEKYES